MAHNGIDRGVGPGTSRTFSTEMTLKERSILFAPAHWFTGRDVGGSEVQWAFDIVLQASRRFGTVDVLLDDLRNGAFPDNVRVHALYPGRQMNYLDPRQAAGFVARYTAAAWRVCRESPPSVMHHGFPWSSRTFNPRILTRGTWLGAPPTTRVVMGPLQQPLFDDMIPAEEGARLTPTPAASTSNSAPRSKVGMLDPILRRLCRITLSRADALIAINNSARKFIEGLGVWTPLHVIPAGVRLEEFPIVDRTGRFGPLRVACVAFFIKRKNINRVLEAVAKVRGTGRDVVLMLVGDGPERPALTALASDLGIDGAVQRLGSVANSDIARIYAEADVFVTMSHRESLPAAVLEAMASGLPVISTKTDGALELVQPDVTGILVDFDDVNALAAALERYADDAGLRMRHGSEARRRIELNYSWNVIGDRYGALYESLLR